MNIKNKLKEAIDDLDPSKYYNQNRRIYNNYFGEENLKNLPFKSVEIKYPTCSVHYDLLEGTIIGEDGTASWTEKEVVTEQILKKIEEIIFKNLKQIKKENEKKFFENEKTDI